MAIVYGAKEPTKQEKPEKGSSIQKPTPQQMVDPLSAFFALPMQLGLKIANDVEAIAQGRKLTVREHTAWGTPKATTTAKELKRKNIF